MLNQASSKETPAFYRRLIMNPRTLSAVLHGTKLAANPDLDVPSPGSRLPQANEAECLEAFEYERRQR